MRVLKIELEGLTTSFRYPFFVLGRQPTYELPPPATIYGHICSAAGEWLDPLSLRFAYRFAHDGKAIDLEHTHMVAATGGTMVPTGGTVKVPQVTKGAIDPVRREFFYRPRLTLYIDRPDLEPVFRRPRYPVALGRSQDLAMYARVECTELERASTAYYEDTLLPLTLQAAVTRGIGVTMPRYIDPERGRMPDFAQYIALVGMLRPGESAGLGDADGHWVDLGTPLIEGARRGIMLLGFRDAET
jgi:CRISPR-associated protein Cas5t